MPFNYPQIIRNEVSAQFGDYISFGFSQAEAELIANSVNIDLYYRDLFWNQTNIVEKVSGVPVTSLPLQKQFLYYPQMLQLLVIGLDYVFYP